jgi:hypothetical protein
MKYFIVIVVGGTVYCPSKGVEGIGEGKARSKACELERLRILHSDSDSDSGGWYTYGMLKSIADQQSKWSIVDC